MHDLTNSTALRQLADLGRQPDRSRWAWTIARPDPQGRLRLPGEARHVLGVEGGRRAVVRGVCHRVALVVAAAGVGAPLVVDSRGRLGLPVWLRRGPSGALVVGTDVGARLAVIASASVLDGLGDLLVGASR
jgi:hypothetical protein